MGAHLSACASSPGTNGPFSVRVARDRKLLGRGRLFIQEDDMYLELTKGEERILQWPIRSIRRYGCDDNLFTFESGRRCNTGPAVFTLECKQAERILKGLQERVDKIREMDERSRRENLDRRPLQSLIGEKVRQSPEYVNSHLLAPGGKAYVNLDANGRHLLSGSPDLSATGETDRRLDYAELDLRQVGKNYENFVELDNVGYGSSLRSRRMQGKLGNLPGMKAGQMCEGFPEEEETLSQGDVLYVEIDPKRMKAASELKLQGF